MPEMCSGGVYNDSTAWWVKELEKIFDSILIYKIG
jgi:hypothetical protein